MNVSVTIGPGQSLTFMGLVVICVNETALGLNKIPWFYLTFSVPYGPTLNAPEIYYDNGVDRDRCLLGFDYLLTGGSKLLHVITIPTNTILFNTNANPIVTGYGSTYFWYSIKQ